MHPLQDRILVKPDQFAEHVSSAGLLIAQRKGITTSQEQLGRTGTVIEVGPCASWYGEKRPKQLPRPCTVLPGERILFGEWEYPEIDGLLVLQEADIVGVIDE